MRPCPGSRSAIAMAVRLLPEPDSPTIPTISPGASDIEMSRTGTDPPGNETESPSHSRTSSVSARPAAAAGGSASTAPAPPLVPAPFQRGGAVRPLAALARASPRRLKPTAASTIATAGASATTGVT